MMMIIIIIINININIIIIIISSIITMFLTREEKTGNTKEKLLSWILETTDERDLQNDEKSN